MTSSSYQPRTLQIVFKKYLHHGVEHKLYVVCVGSICEVREYALLGILVQSHELILDVLFAGIIIVGTCNKESLLKALSTSSVLYLFNKSVSC